MISVLSRGQTQDEVGSDILFFFLGVDQRFWLGFRIGRVTLFSPISCLPCCSCFCWGEGRFQLLDSPRSLSSDVDFGLDFQFFRMHWT